MKKGENAVFSVDENVPSDARVGEYTAGYTLETDAGMAKGQVSLKVWNYVMLVKSYSHAYMGNTAVGDNVYSDMNDIKTFLRHRLNSNDLMSRERYDQLEPLGQQYNAARLWGKKWWGKHGNEMLEAPTSIRAIGLVFQLLHLL